MARIAFMTFGVLYEARAHSRSKGFIDHMPTFIELTARLERLHAHGPERHAFNFKRSFDADGNPTVVDRALAKEIAARNARPRA